MNNVELYRTNNQMQKRGTVECLEEYTKNMKWKKYGERVLDIGCADGSGTSLLKSYIPDNYKQLVGCDISEEMVRYANEHHGFGRTSFRVLDIEGELPDELRGGFDHVFSFYTLHWIINQEKCFKNIYDILAEDGDCLLLFVANTPIFVAYRKLAQSNKWGFQLKDAGRFVSPYHDSTDPEEEVKKLMEKVGFTEVEVKCKDMVYVYEDVDEFKKSIAAIIPPDIPKELLEEFMDDFMQVVWDTRVVIMDKANNDTETIRVTHKYRIIVANAKKPADKIL